MRTADRGNSGLADVEVACKTSSLLRVTQGAGKRYAVVAKARK